MVADGQQSSLPSPSRIDLFAGYSYWQANGSAGGVAFSNANHGVLISGAYYLNSNFGFELIGDYHFTGGNDSMRSVSLGPILRGNPYHGFTPFIHGLAGATNMLGPGAFYSGHSEPQPATWGREITLGAGVDYSLPYFHHHLNLRLFQAGTYTLFNQPGYCNAGSPWHTLRIRFTRSSRVIVFAPGGDLAA